MCPFLHKSVVTSSTKVYHLSVVYHLPVDDCGLYSPWESHVCKNSIFERPDKTVVKMGRLWQRGWLILEHSLFLNDKKNHLCIFTTWTNTNREVGMTRLVFEWICSTALTVTRFWNKRRSASKDKIALRQFFEVTVSVVSPRQTSIYVMCPWDHDIWSLLFTTHQKPVIRRKSWEPKGAQIGRRCVEKWEIVPLTPDINSRSIYLFNARWMHYVDESQLICVSVR